MKKVKQYCCYCGEDITVHHIEGKDREHCTACGTIFYENPLPVASSIVINEKREVLLVKRKNDPYKDMWCLPIGFAESGESVADAALRELEEESGVKGSIVRLIDVDTVENYFYGSLAIVTYEVKQTGGTMRPGDDASDAAYYPIADHPPLAWSSNEKALDIYVDLYKETWAMIDSFRSLLSKDALSSDIIEGNIKGRHLADIIIKIISKDTSAITERWLRDISNAIPALLEKKDILSSMNEKIISLLCLWLEGKKKIDYSPFEKDGHVLRAQGVSLPDLLNAMALSRRSLWIHVSRKRIISSPMDIYSALELNNRIIYLYDRVIYHFAKGYEGKV